MSRYRIFKGTDTEYRQLHYWVETQLGKPQYCTVCNINDIRRYEWANISGQYLRDISDWERLCTSCHSRKDGSYVRQKNLKKNCVRGHELTDENVYMRPRKTWLFKTCRECSRIARRKYNRKIKEMKSREKINV